MPAGLLALALTLSTTAGAAPITVIGTTSGPISNPGIADYILIDQSATVNGDITNGTTGTVPGDDTHAAVGVYDGSTVSGAITNLGSIGGASLANYAIEVRDSNITAGIHNQGPLASAWTAVIVDAWSGSFSGGISNTATLSAGAEGIAFEGKTFSGDISNSGDIASTQTGLFVYVDDPDDEGLGRLDGNLTNSGTIGSSDNTAIGVYALSMSGGFSNTDTGRVIAASDKGVYLDIGAIGGGLSNAGEIESSGHALHARGQSLAGGLANSGTVLSTAGNGVVLSFDAVSGGIQNTGSITSNGGDALSLDVTSLDAGITNTGLIEAIDTGIALASGSGVTGDIRNNASGEVRATVGIDLVDTSIEGTIANAGVITAGSGILISGTSEVTGGLRNEGTIDADVSIAVSADSVSGDVVNTGTLIGDLSLAGTGTSGGGINVLSSGAIDLGVPSFAPSLISGDYSQSATGSLAITIQTFADYAGVPALTVLGDLVISGDLLLGVDAGFSFLPFQRLTLVGVGGARTGTFGNYADNALVMGFGDGRGLFINYTAEGDIDLYTNPVPPTWLLMGFGVLGLRRSRRGQN